MSKHCKFTFDSHPAPPPISQQQVLPVCRAPAPWQQIGCYFWGEYRNTRHKNDNRHQELIEQCLYLELFRISHQLMGVRESGPHQMYSDHYADYVQWVGSGCTRDHTDPAHLWAMVSSLPQLSVQCQAWVINQCSAVQTRVWCHFPVKCLII